MKNLRQLCAGLILTLALTITASAGQMDCPGATASSQATVADSAQPQDNVVGKSTGSVPPAESNLANGFSLISLILSLF